MSEKADAIRLIADNLAAQSVSSNADANAAVTKNELKKLKDSVVLALYAVADALDS